MRHETDETRSCRCPVSSVRVPVTPCVTSTDHHHHHQPILRDVKKYHQKLGRCDGRYCLCSPAPHRRPVTQKLKHFRLPPASSRAASSECVSCHSSWCSIELSTGLREILQCPHLVKSWSAKILTATISNDLSSATRNQIEKLEAAKAA